MKTFGTFHNVRLTDGDIETLHMKFASEGLDGEFLDRCIDRLSAFMAQEGRTYQNHAAAILGWAKTAVLEDDRKTGNVANARQGTQPSYKDSEEQRLRDLWESASEQDKQDYLKAYGGKMPWEIKR